MKNYLIYTSALALAFLTTCSVSRNQNKIDIIDVKSDAEYLLVDQMQVQKMTNVVKIVYEDNFKMFIITKNLNHTKDTYNPADQTINSVVTKVDTTYIYYIVEKGLSHGLVYGKNRTDQLKGEIFSLDSLLRFTGLDSANYKVLNINLGEPSQVVKKNTQKIEKFLINKSADTDPDSIYRFYDTRLQSVEYSFSPELDKKNKSKLVKAQFIYNASHSVKNNMSIPRREISWEMSLGTYSEKILNEYFERFEIDSQKNNLK